MNTLEQAQEEINKPVDGVNGYLWTEIRDNKELHWKVMYDQHGIMKRYNPRRKILQYSDASCTTNKGTWRTTGFDWEDCYMEGYNLPFLRLYTLEEFKRILPFYVEERLNDDEKSKIKEKIKTLANSMFD